MLIDCRELDSATTRQTEICIIGAGVAGITAARRLLAAGHEVVILESGGGDYDRRSANLNDGDVIGRDYYPLREARLRLVGGTTAIWGGRCAELDPVDLEKRDWVRGSGWPIGWNELDRYYREARPLFGLRAEPTARTEFAHHGVDLPRFDPRKLHMPTWSFDAQSDRFTLARCSDLIAHPRCTLISHATVTGLHVNENAQAITSIAASCTTGASTIWIVPRVALLAAGGIENARLLLSSRSVVPVGLGNEHDQVGRCFMEHPHARGGRIVDARPWTLLRAFGRHSIEGEEVAALISPSRDVQQRHEILNSSLTIVARKPEFVRKAWAMRVYDGLRHDMSPTRTGRRVWRATKKTARAVQAATDPLRPWLLCRMGRAELTLSVRAEQAPEPASRITLGPDRDALGMQRVKLDWRLGEIDKRSVAILVDTLGTEMARLGLGRVEPAPWLSDHSQQWRSDPLVSTHAIGGYHHIGTTRMSTDRRRGVTDGRGCLHGTDNLFVLGSSTFPTSGWANPTLTIAALALRTADIVSAELRSNPGVRVRAPEPAFS